MTGVALLAQQCKRANRESRSSLRHQLHIRATDPDEPPSCSLVSLGGCGGKTRGLLVAVDVGDLGSHGVAFHVDGKNLLFGAASAHGKTGSGQELQSARKSQPGAKHNVQVIVWSSLKESKRLAGPPCVTGPVQLSRATKLASSDAAAVRRYARLGTWAGARCHHPGQLNVIARQCRLNNNQDEGAQHRTAHE